MASKRASADDLRAAVQEFVGAHPEGWGHEEWMALLDELGSRGHAVGDPDAIGRLVERERLAAMLGKIEKVGPQRIKVITDRYETVWSLRAVDVDGLTESTRIPRSLAERIKQAV